MAMDISSPEAKPSSDIDQSTTAPSGVSLPERVEAPAQVPPVFTNIGPALIQSLPEAVNNCCPSS
ncbi:hypothetical protein GCM10010293_49890 [Streptomyces griseoflavus]|nr:hypothetical protein GCM10010293_49890 [Streptomyces griseoflavus]